MKKNNKNIVKSIIATSIATAGFVSYKIIKKRYPDKIDYINKNIKNNISNLKKNKPKIENLPLDKYNINTTNNVNENTISKLNTNIDVSTNAKITLENEPANKENLENNYIEKLQELQKHINSTIKENEENILMPDNYIEDEIRYQLCLPNKQPITKNILQRLERIDFFEIDDKDIDIYCDFLKKYTNIKSIVIDALNPLKHEDMKSINKDKHCLKNIKPINSLISLEELSFNWGIESIDFSSLTDLKNLKKLEIKFGMLENIDFIKNFENLEHLEIMIANNVKDLSVLKNLQNLKRLYIYTNTNLDLSILKNVPSLEYVYLNGESIEL